MCISKFFGPVKNSLTRSSLSRGQLVISLFQMLGPPISQHWWIGFKPQFLCTCRRCSSLGKIARPKFDWLARGEGGGCIWPTPRENEPLYKLRRSQNCNPTTMSSLPKSPEFYLCCCFKLAFVLYHQGAFFSCNFAMKLLDWLAPDPTHS